LVPFFLDHAKLFPVLWILAQRKESLRVAEVGCERFFNLSGYVSSPKRTRTNVRNYERLALLAKNLSFIYVDNDWVAKEYIRRCRMKLWKKDDDEDILKCWNTELALEAANLGQGKPEELSMGDIEGAEERLPAEEDEGGGDEESQLI